VAFIDEKDSGLIPQILSIILDECVNGITLADPDLDDMPIVYANKAFEQMTGYTQADIIGRNCRFLQNEDTDQSEVLVLSDAIKERKQIEVTLRNYKKNGQLFYNRLKVIPLFDHAGKLLYFLGVQYDVTEQVEKEAEIRVLNQKLNAK
jgi:PAS domain S-box-containing protein